MGYDGRFTGAITITPPIPATEIRSNTLLPVGDYLPYDSSDVALTITDLAPPTSAADGSIVVRRAATSITAAMSHFSGYQIVKQVQEVIDRWGAGRAFTGRIECVGPEGDIWGVAVVDGRATRIEPQIVWPGEGEA